jgi:hypothetical protein
MSDSMRSLRRIHQELWDPVVGLERYAPGAVPGVDISPFNLHSIRESALSAFLDFQDGHTSRANRSIETLLDHQYRDAGVPWFGTFKVTVEQADPPSSGAEMWLHYDPNWRQFLGCILALTLIVFEQDIPPPLQSRIIDSLKLCVEGEPSDRLPSWYTNPNLMHAWLTSWFGSRTNDDDLVETGLARAELLFQRFVSFGDFDEYNSPTYDGIDLFAISLWIAYPPAPRFHEVGTHVRDRLTARISGLFHPGLRNVCGPYIRAYGLEMDKYVSLTGLWLSMSGLGEELLPPELTVETVHVHDLYFLPVFEHLRTAALVEFVALPTDQPRTHVQIFGSVTSTSILAPKLCIGGETGRIPDFAKDQYFPLVTHFIDVDGNLGFLGMQLGENSSNIDVAVTENGEAHMQARGLDSPFTLIMRTSEMLEGNNATLTSGVIELTFSEPVTISDRRVGTTGEEVLKIEIPHTTVDIQLKVKS